jgi:hypothetical protein
MRKFPSLCRTHYHSFISLFGHTNCSIHLELDRLHEVKGSYITESARYLDIRVGKPLALRPALSIDLQYCVLFPVLNGSRY